MSKSPQSASPTSVKPWCVWDRQSGKPVHRAIVWQDRRTARFCDELKQKGLEPLFTQKTGLLLDPYFSGTKLSWLLKNVDGLKARAEKGEICFGTVDTGFIYKLTGGKVSCDRRDQCFAHADL